MPILESASLKKRKRNVMKSISTPSKNHMHHEMLSEKQNDII